MLLEEKTSVIQQKPTGKDARQTISPRAMVATREAPDDGSGDWVVSWASGGRGELLVHRYYFKARDEEEALEKALVWTRKPACPLPRHTRFTRRGMFLTDLGYYPLLFWQIFWLEAGEKHDLLIFHTPDKAATTRQACQWAAERREALDRRQALLRLRGEQCEAARFNPDEGELLFAYQSR